MGKKRRALSEEDRIDEIVEQTSESNAEQGQTGQQSAKSSAAAQQHAVTLDDSSVEASYANFCRVSSTPEELILDLGLNPNPYSAGGIPIKVSQRVIMNHYTAKRLLSALAMAVQRHEKAFGILETDVRKRVQVEQPSGPENR